MWREDMHANLTEAVARRGGGNRTIPPPTPKREWQNAFPQTLHGKVDFLGYQGPKRPTFPSYLTTLHYLIPLVRKQRACYVPNQEAKDGPSPSPP